MALMSAGLRNETSLIQNVESLRVGKMPCETVLIQSSWDGILPTLQLNLMVHVGCVTSVNNLCRFVFNQRLKFKMDNKTNLSTQILVYDRVKFFHNNQEYLGYVSKKGRKYAYIVCDDQRECKVPYDMLSKISGATQRQVQSRADQLRLQFQVNDRVSFELKGQVVQGVLIRLNPKRAHVLCDDDKEYQVPYGLLTVISTTQNGSAINRNATELNAIFELARELMAQHQLSHWSFQFDQGTQRAGCCNYNTQVISVSIAYAKQCSETEIKETILHEIAHALVGKEHNHDAVWKAKAIEIGCSGRRCHDVQFTPSRYIVKCQNNCWVATAERRRRGGVCKKCRGDIVYLTYTEERWDIENSKRNDLSA